MSIHTESYAAIVAEAEVSAAEAAASATAAALSATNADASADDAAYWAQIASLTTYGFELLADLTAFTTAADHESATVWGDTDANNGIYHWDDGGSVWVSDAEVALLQADVKAFLADYSVTI
jgi:hypothetical protein